MSIGREAFAAACRKDGSVKQWFESLRLELEEPGPGCLASLPSCWPLLILCVPAALVLLALWQGDGGAGSGSVG